jgi:hypothetical protein
MEEQPETHARSRTNGKIILMFMKWTFTINDSIIYGDPSSSQVFSGRKRVVM